MLRCILGELVWCAFFVFGWSAALGFAGIDDAQIFVICKQYESCASSIRDDHWTEGGSPFRSADVAIEFTIGDGCSHEKAHPVLIVSL